MRDDGELARASPVELAASRLTREILAGGVEPGGRPVEEQLTRPFGTGGARRREALRLLAQRGLVEHMPRRGVRVAILSDTDIRELYAVRDVLERHAVAATPHDTDLAGVAAAVKAMQEAD